MDYEYLAEPAQPEPGKRELTIGQQVAARLCVVLAGDLDSHSTRAEQHTAALLRLCADAIERGYEAELVRRAREWRRDVEQMGAEQL